MHRADVCIVTPCLNAATTIDETILSVLSQAGDFHLRYHVQDAGSDDGTVERLERWAALLRSAVSLPCLCRSVHFSFASEPDHGMYDGINRAFNLATGDLMSWINADDLLVQGAVQSVREYLREYSEDSWVGGRTVMLRHDGIRATEVHARCYSTQLIDAGLYDGKRLPFIQQEGQFWRRELWESVGGANASLRYAGDFELWTRFARHAEPISLDVPLGAFRVHARQKTSAMRHYNDELWEVQKGFTPAKVDQLYAKYLFGESFPGVMGWYDKVKDGWKREYLEIRGDSLVRQVFTLSSMPSWQIRSGADLPEGPFPERGINRVIRWMVGNKTVIQFRNQRAGEYQIYLMLLNYHVSQKILIVSENRTLATAEVPKNDRDHRPFVISFGLSMRPGERAVEIFFSKVERGRFEKRPLSCALLGLEIVEAAEGTVAT